MTAAEILDQPALIPQETGTASVYQPEASAGNDEEAGYQPASPVEQSAATAK
ncbi:hypothetical protein [Streptomyces sp. NPDC055140]